MTHDEFDTDQHEEPAGHLEIDALLDGEPVDRETLRQVLSAADAREYLLDALVLRQFTREMGPLAYVEPVRRAGWRQWTAAAAVALVAAAGGYLARGTFGGQPRVSSVEAVVDLESAVRAPQPTHVIQLESSSSPQAAGENQ